jgi:hypothetical protein
MSVTHCPDWNPERKEILMKTAVSKPKSKVVADQQPKTTQVPVPQQAHGIPCPKSAQTTKPTIDDIAKRAYEIYLEKGCQQGQCEENWKQAEQELTKGLKVVSA